MPPTFDASFPTPVPRLRWTRGVALAGSAFLLSAIAALLSAALAPDIGPVAGLWLPSGLLVGTLLCFPPRHWAWIIIGWLAGIVALQDLRGTPFAVIIVEAIGDVVSSLLGAVLVRRFCRRADILEGEREVSVFLVAAGLLATAVGSALEGLAHGALGGLQSFGEHWQRDWLADAGGVVLVAPVVIAWHRRPPKRATRSRTRETLWLAALTLAAVWLLQSATLHLLAPPRFLLLPVVIWAALRLGIRTVVTYNLALAIVGSWVFLRSSQSAAAGADEVAHAGFLWQMFFASCAAVGLLLASFRAQGQANAGALREETRRLKRTEEELHKLSRAIEQSPAVILITDREGAIEYVNPAFTEVTGYTFAEVRGRRPSLLKSGEMPDAVYRELWAAITAGRQWRGDFHNRKKNGELFWESAIVSPIHDEHGTITHFLAVKEDITARKLLEAQVRHMQKVDAIGQLAGGVAHDFNNILSATMLHLTLLQREPQMSPEVRASLKELELESRRAATLTRQLLLFSRRQPMRTERIDLNDVVMNLIKMLRRLIGENIRLTFPGTGAPKWIEADPGMIEQVILNLCVNARDAMPQGGTLTIDIGGVEFAHDLPPESADARPGRYVRLSVTDTGTGIDEATRKRLFEPFFTTKEAGKGTGLGLATAYGIMRQHRGWIAVDSDVGRGATFHVYLPEAVSAPPAALGDEISPPLAGSETILVVEDDENMRRMITLTLEAYGYRTLTAASGREAMAVWAQEREGIELLLSDVVMPEGISGPRLAQQLRATKPSLRTVLMSGYATDLSDKKASHENEFTFLPKPFRAEVLVATVRRALNTAK